MGLTKTEIFSKEQNEMASLAKVLGHPARIAILERLLELQSCICGELVNEIGLSQPTVSQHLKELKNMGLIKGTISGTSVCYCIDAEKWGEVSQLFENFFTKKPGNNSCC